MLETKLDAEAVVYRIHLPVREINTCYTPTLEDSHMEKMTTALNCNVENPPLKRCIWVVWESPEKDHMKLNFDGSSTAGKAAGGGVMRDEKGNIRLAYAISNGPI